jgi:hypothetical protein
VQEESEVLGGSRSREQRNPTRIRESGHGRERVTRATKGSDGISEAGRVTQPRNGRPNKGTTLRELYCSNNNKYI